MHRDGRDRRALLVSMCPLGDVVVDVGADHGHVARSLGAIATERAPERIAVRGEGPWVVADGLRPFRRVDVAVIAGMGAHTILGILAAGPRPARALLHAQDDPPTLRLGLAAAGWRIEREGLAREAGRFAEVILAAPGAETAEGLELEYGPRLLGGDDPLLQLHLRQLLGWLDGVLEQTRGRDVARRADWEVRRAFLAGVLKRRWAL
jgi:tRNA A22 N-methylase